MSEKHMYSMTIAWSEADAAYIAICPEFTGVSGIGASIPAAVTEAQTALELAIATYQGEGWELPVPRSHRSHEHHPQPLHAMLLQGRDVGYCGAMLPDGRFVLNGRRGLEFYSSERTLLKYNPGMRLVWNPEADQTINHVDEDL